MLAAIRSRPGAVRMDGMGLANRGRLRAALAPAHPVVKHQPFLQVELEGGATGFAVVPMLGAAAAANGKQRAARTGGDAGLDVGVPLPSDRLVVADLVDVADVADLVFG